MGKNDEAYLIVLQGQGDTSVFWVAQEVWNWIHSSESPGRTGDETSWVDQGAPDSVVQGAQKEIQEYNEKFGVEQDIEEAVQGALQVTTGSLQNDRAMIARFAADEVFQGEMEAQIAANNAGITLMETYQGQLY